MISGVVNTRRFERRESEILVIDDLVDRVVQRPDRAGTALVFNGYLLHRSLENSGRPGYRRALANHYMSAESLLPWRRPEEEEWMAIADYRDIVLVAGEDPYAYKGTADLSVTHTRPDREGGCDR